MASIEGKTALVTGASRGIGSASAIALARAGARQVLLHYNSYRPGAEETAEEIRRHGAEPRLFQADFTTVEGIRAFCGEIRGIPVDLLVNNAGHLVGRATLLEATDDLFDHIFTLNVKSALFVSQAAAPHMLERGEGAIVNISSIAGRHGGGVGATMYAAAKAAVTTMTRGMARELAPKGVRVNAVSPGVVDNNFHVQHSTGEMMKNALASIPAGRLGANEDIADVVVFLCSDASRFIFGQTIEVNGGALMV